jgi:esterase/lipase superfamily enzyme/Flp pilus assembly protein TadD
MVRRPSLRAVALIIFIAFLATIQSSTAPAQQSDDLARLQRQVQQLDQAGKYTEALALTRRIAAETEKAETASAGKPSAKTANALIGVAWYSLLAGDFKEALAVSDRAHALDPSNLAVETNRAHALLLSGRVQEAQALLAKAGVNQIALKDINSELGGKSGASDADLTELRQRIQELNRTGSYEEAAASAEKYVTLARERYTEAHPKFATAIFWLGYTFKSQGRTAEAEPLFKRALAIEEKALGPDHPDVGTLLNNLAVLYHSEGRYAEAEPLYKRALAIREKALGPDHPDVGTVLSNLAGLYENQGKVKDAEPLYRRAVAIAEKALGPDHPDLARYRSNLGGLLKSQDRLGEAEPLLKSAVEINEKVFGTDHPFLAKALTQLGDLYRLQGKCEQAQPLFLRARSIGGAAIQEVPVLFATDRKRDLNRPSVTFGGEREEKLSFGIAIVTVPQEQANIGTTSGSRSDNKTSAAQIIEARHLAMHCIEVVGDRQIVAAAVHQIDVAKTYPAQALIFVHGYNVSFENAARRVAQIAYDIKFDGATFLFSWPSQERLWGYFSDSDAVDIAADHLRDFLEKIVAETKVRKIHFVAHSMGNMVLLRALERVTRENQSLRELIGEIIEAAPDVDQGVYAHMLRTIDPDGDRKFTLYASRGDWALRVSGWLRGFTRAGYISKDKPLVVPGVDTIDISEAGTSIFALNHDLYSSNPILVADMRRIIEKSERPPDERTREFEPVTSPDGTYWRLVLSRAEVSH